MDGLGLVGFGEGEGGRSQGVASGWEAMISSMEASPQGASEQYMWRVRDSRQEKGCGAVGERSAWERRWR